jgi:hypothetical protein
MSDDSFTHEPLPYVITLRSTLDDDAPPTVREFKVTAYSLFEAVIQATVEAGGSGLADEKHKAERIAPDLDAYWKVKAWREEMARTHGK